MTSNPAETIPGPRDRHVRRSATGTSRRARLWLRAVLRRLDQTQWWTAERMRGYQQDGLRRILKRAYATVPFYRRRFDDAGLGPDELCDRSSWLDIPLLTRRDIQLAHADLMTTDSEVKAKGMRRVVTSGSTGQPVMVASTPMTRRCWQALTLRDHLWHRRDFSRPLAVIRNVRRGMALPPHGLRRNGWGSATDALIRTGPGCMLSLEATIEQQGEWLLKQNPGYLLSYPSNLAALAAWFRQTGHSLETLRGVRTFGEILMPQIRQECERAWGVPVVDVYSAQEVGYVALQCPESEHYHVQSESVIVEILDARGRLCAPGEIGRVVITTLHNFATPLIRYDIGDFAEVGEACACGRGLPVLARIVGRQRNMVTLPTGEMKWPALGQASDLQHLPFFNQFQLVQRSPEEIEVVLVAPRSLSAREEDDAKRYLSNILAHPFRFRFRYVNEIARGPGGKYEDFRSEIRAGNEHV